MELDFNIDIHIKVSLDDGSAKHAKPGYKATAWASIAGHPEYGDKTPGYAHGWEHPEQAATAAAEQTIRSLRLTLPRSSTRSEAGERR